MDLVVAVPVALSVQMLWLRAKGPAHWIAMAVALAMTLAWLIAFRTGVALAIPSGVATRIAAGATVVVPVTISWWVERTMIPRR
jgi:hypothetical protein